MNNRSGLMFLLAGALSLVLTGCAATGPQVTDQSIADSIKSDLEAASGPQGPFEVDIMVEDGEVTLSGDVPSTSSKEQAMQIASEAEGVEEINSYLIVIEE